MKNWNGYIHKLTLAMEEKLFFIRDIDLDEYDLILDFGCADGELIRRMTNYTTEASFLGYDISPQMIAKAFGSSMIYNNITFTSNFDKVLNMMKKAENVLVIFSSIWHEIDFKQYHSIMNIFALANTIVVRDMFYENDFMDGLEELTEVELNSLRRKISPHMMDTFEKQFGKVTHKDITFYHLMLKYTYVDNWDTEVLEYYFKTPWDDIIERAETFGYKKYLDYKYTLNFKKQQVLNDFGIELTKPTHRNLIMKREQL